jgi:hypothetical protein
MALQRPHELHNLGWKRRIFDHKCGNTPNIVCRITCSAPCNFISEQDAGFTERIALFGRGLRGRQEAIANVSPRVLASLYPQTGAQENAQRRTISVTGRTQGARSGSGTIRKRFAVASRSSCLKLRANDYLKIPTM